MEQAAWTKAEEDVLAANRSVQDIFLSLNSHTHTHTHNRFTALLEYVRDYPGEQVPER